MDYIKVEKNNIDGVKIIKEIPKELLSNYIAIGWKVVKETSKESKPIITKEKNQSKEEKVIDSEDL